MPATTPRPGPSSRPGTPWFRVPGFLLNMGHTERRLGHAARARSFYLRYLAAEPESTQRDEVLGLIAELEGVLGASPAPVPVPPPPSQPAEPPPSSEADPVAARPPSPPPLPAAPEPREEPAPVVSARAGDSSDAGDSFDAGDSSDDLPAAPPLYRRWWFWAALGAVAVGTTTAIVLGTRPTNPSFQSDGSLGRIGGP
jgi:hypothetical protein